MDQVYIIAILLGIMVLGVVSDFLGLGLAIPDGTPLGATLVEKSGTFIIEILMPFSYVYIGLYTHDLEPISQGFVFLEKVNEKVIKIEGGYIKDSEL